jgi:hypothetical protein
MVSTELERILRTANSKKEWDDIWNTVKARYEMWEASKGANFKIGDSVQFDIEKGRNYGHYTGIITALKTKSAQIQTPRGQWTVGYAFLKPLILNKVG